MTPSQIRKLTSTISDDQRKRTLGIIGLCVAGTILGVMLPFGIILVVVSYIVMFKQRSRLQIDPLIVSSITWRWIAIMLLILAGTALVVHPELINQLQPADNQFDSEVLEPARIVFALLFYGTSLLLWSEGYRNVKKYLKSKNIKGKSPDKLFV